MPPTDNSQATLGKRKNLTQGVIDAIRKRITDGDVKPGEQLPTEPGLTREFGVSRTVIREAIAALSADGLVEARHGVGIFVLDPADRKGKLGLFSVDVDRVSSILEALELRAGVEIEAAGLAALRRSPAQEAKISEAFEILKTAAEDGDSADAADLTFHGAIAEATNNILFKEFIDIMPQRLTPLWESMGHGMGAAKELRLTRTFIDEHRSILAAISERDAEGAREAMRIHLDQSRERIRTQSRKSA